jgi:hypothetical protein
LVARIDDPSDERRTLNHKENTMGDKSPKSKQKNKSQKDSKNTAIAKEKQRVIDSKKIVAAPPKKKK